MTMLARIKTTCNGETHHVSIWEPGDEDLCGAEHIIYARNGKIICYEDHDAELELTVTDLTGEQNQCFTRVEYCRSARISHLVEYNNIQPLLFTMHITKQAKQVLDHALICATRSSDVINEAIKVLLQFGANSRADQDIPIRNAASVGNVDIIETLIKAGANVHTQEDEPFRKAVEKGNIPLIKLLASCGANVGVRDNWALHYAVKRKSMDVVDAVIDAGAILDQEAMFYAISENKSGVLRVLTNRGLPLEPYHLSYAVGVPPMFKHLLKSINLRSMEKEDHDHYVKLIRILVTQISSYGGNFTCMKFLLDHGVDPDFENGHPIKEAVHNNNPVMLKLLLDRGADVNIDHGWILLDAAKMGRKEIVDLLLKRNIQVAQEIEQPVAHFLDRLRGTP
jgi:ankyrin repeat protein